jgi:hypothetical protein
MKRFYYILVLIALFSKKGFSQVAKDDFARINKTYADNMQLSMKIRYDVYKNKSTATPLQAETGEIKRNEAAKYTRIGNIETIENENYKLIVDNEDKNISVLGGTIEEKKPGGNDGTYLVNLENLLSICSKLEFQKISEAQNCYSIVIPAEEYSEIKVFYNSKTFFIEKMIFYYNEIQNLEGQEKSIKEAPRMEISYYDVKLKPDFGSTPFTYDNFLEKRKGQFVGKGSYKEYRINEQSIIK